MTNFDESIGDINTNAPTEDPSMKTGSSHKRTSAVWNEFKRVLVDGIYKAKYRKCTKLYSCFSSGGTRHLKRHQKSHRLIDSHLQSTLQTHGGALVGTFAYNNENQRKVIVK